MSAKLKAVKEALTAKDWALVEKRAADLLTFEPANYNARVFLALALFNLSQFDDSEQNYKKAIEGAPTQPLARQGLAAFYEKRLRWSDCAWALTELMELFLQANDATKYAETLQKLLSVQRSHGTRQELISALSHLLPTSPSYALLLTLPPANPTNPTASTIHTLQLSLRSPLTTLLEIIALTETLESDSIETEIKKRRMKLGGITLTAAETRQSVQLEVMASSRLPGLYREVLEDPDAAEREDLRRETERKLLAYWRTVLKASPTGFGVKEVNLKKVEKSEEKKVEEQRAKDTLRGEVEELAKGMVLIGVREVEAWNVVLEWSDANGKWGDVDWRELERFVELFPETGLGSIAHELRRTILFNQVSPKVVDEDADGAVEETPPPLTPDEMTQVIEKGLQSSPDSLLAHILSAHFFSEQKDWDALVQVSEAGKGVLERLEGEIGRNLSTSRRTLDEHLAVGLVYLDPPTHHLRAMRLLDNLLADSQSPENIPLLVAKSHIYLTSSSWSCALPLFDFLLPNLAPTDPLHTRVTGDRSWCLFKEGQLDDACLGLLDVVENYTERKVKRDEERMEWEKKRAKGTEGTDGTRIEGESEAEMEERAKAWWRLGECFWVMAEDDPSLVPQAYHAFTSSIRALSTYAPSFTSLGIYYLSLESPDYSHASKCFQKAFELDGEEDIAARYLAEEYAEKGEWAAVEVIASRVVGGNGNEGAKSKRARGKRETEKLAWAWKAIGGADLKSKKFPQAIVAFQSALRGTPVDVHTWIKLGVAYRSSGKHIAALKVFEKALGIDPSSWYCRFSIGDVQREIGLLEPALETFRSVLVDRPDELGVRVVLAETALALGLEEFRTGFLARSEKSLIESLEEATNVIKGGSPSRVAWKIVGDALVALGKIPEPTLLETSQPIALRILAIVEEQEVDSKIDGMDAITCTALHLSLSIISDSSNFFAALAVLAFKMRVLLETQNEPSIGSAWFDLGVSIAASRKHLVELGIPVPDEEALSQAVRCLKFALHKEPLNSIFWNSLGVLSFNLSPRLSQHCFIKSIEYNTRSATPWTNLGLFYLIQGDEDLANQAFLKAQVLDPESAPAWIGQGTLADLNGQSKEAAVLFEHAFSLGGNNPEADIGFATRAYNKHRSSFDASSSSSPSSFSAATASLSAPLFACTRYLSHRPNDITGLHLNALILEQVGDLPTAVESLEKAALILEQMYEVDESPMVESQYVIAQTNLGRVRLASGDYDGAVAAFEAALSLINLDANENGEEVAAGGLSKDESVLLLTECKLGSGLAYHWMEESDRAVEVLEQGLEDIEGYGGKRRCDLAIALGRVYWCQGDEDRALGSFIDAPDVHKESSPRFVRHSIHALAIVTKDRAVLEMIKRLNLDDSGRFDAESTRLNVLQHLEQGNQTGALSCNSHTLHATPWAGQTRRAFTRHLIATSPVSGNPDSMINLQICGRILRTQVEGEDWVGRSWRQHGLVLVALSKEEEGEEGEALRLAQRAVRIAPWEGKWWRDLRVVRSAVE